MALEAEHLMRTYGRPPMVLVRGEGCRVWDSEGRSYLDFLAGIGVNVIGHCHPRLVEAIRQQAGSLLHTSNLYYTEPQALLARRLAERAPWPDGTGRAFFCNSGTEANEAAIKLARKAAHRAGQPERLEVLSFEGAFHGRTFGSLAATARGSYQEGFGPMPAGFRELPWGDLEAVAAAASDRTCAILVEPVQGEGGVRPAPPGFLAGLRHICDRWGICLVADEVQCGLGRTGRLWACEHDGVQPDVMTLAKGLGGGLPIGCALARGPWGEALRAGDHGSTFGGGPLVCRASLAVLDVIAGEDLPARAASLGRRLMDRLAEVCRRLPFVAEVRGAGLMIGLELRFPCRDLVEVCRQRGLLINCTAGRVLRLLPPLVLSEAEADEGASILVEVLQTEGARLAAAAAS